MESNGPDDTLQDDCAFLRMFEGSFSLVEVSIITQIVNGGWMDTHMDIQCNTVMWWVLKSNQNMSGNTTTEATPV